MNVYNVVFNQITEQLKNGVAPWKKPWTGGNRIQWAVNAVNGKEYTGSNASTLLIAQMCGHTSNKYATYKQWKEMGRQVKKDSEGVPIVFWSRKEGKEGTEEKGYCFARYYKVFNESQLVDYELPVTKKINFEPIDECKRVLIESPIFNVCRIVHDKQSAYYNPLLDYINMPKPESFDSNEAYYSTLFHEMGHATGHESRLNRDLSNQFGDHSYSREELVAELTSAFLSVLTGINNQVEQSSSYCASWLKKFEDHPKEMLQAFTQAKKATDYILNRVPAIEPTETTEYNEVTV